jgi:hypothetical protein
MPRMLLVTKRNYDCAVCIAIASILISEKIYPDDFITYHANNDRLECSDYVLEFIETYKHETPIIYILGDCITRETADKLNYYLENQVIESIRMYYNSDYSMRYIWALNSIRPICDNFKNDSYISSLLKKAKQSITYMINQYIYKVRICLSEEDNKRADEDMWQLVDFICMDIRDGNPDEDEVFMRTQEYVHFTHCDMDAAGAAIALDVFSKYGAPKYKHTFCKNPEDCTNKVNEFLANKSDAIEYHVLISDVSLLQNDTNSHIDLDVEREIHPESIVSLQMYDHHKTALWMNSYEWADVAVERYGHKTSGAELVYKELLSTITVNEDETAKKKSLESLGQLIELIRLWDTFDWKEDKQYGTFAYWHSILFSKLGMEKYIQKMEEYIFNGQDPMQLEQDEFKIVENELMAIEKYYEEVKARIGYINIFEDPDYDGQGYRYGIAFCNRYTSVIGNRICEENDDIDFVVLLNSDRGVAEVRASKDFDTSIFSKAHGGGGHAKASGFSIDPSIYAMGAMEIGKLVNSRGK